MKKNSIILDPQYKLKEQSLYLEPSISLIFSPVKKNNTDFIIQKATELGVTELIPVRTSNTIVDNFKISRAIQISIEAAEQSNRLSIPKINKINFLKSIIDNWDSDKLIIWGSLEGKKTNINYI